MSDEGATAKERDDAVPTPTDAVRAAGPREAETVSETVPSSTAHTSGPTDALDAAWQSLRAHWDDEAKHKAFVALASSLARLPDAGRRYRDAAGDPALRERAEKGKQLVLALAMATVETLPRTERASKGALIAPVAALLLLFASNFLFATLARSRAPLSAWVFVVEIALVLVIPWRRFQRGN